MGKESDFWNYLTDVRKHGLWAQRIESSIGSGTPDVHYAKLTEKARGVGSFDIRKTGWVELKVIDEFPKRPTTVVKIDHYTPQQRNWARMYPGIVWMLIKVMEPKSFYLFHGKEAALYLAETWTKADWDFFAVKRWDRRVDFPELVQTLLI